MANNTENILHDMITCGLADDEIQLDLPGKESGKISASHLLEGQDTDTTCSQFHSTKQSDLKDRKKHLDRRSMCLLWQTGPWPQGPTENKEEWEHRRRKHLPTLKNSSPPEEGYTNQPLTQPS